MNVLILVATISLGALLGLAYVYALRANTRMYLAGDVLWRPVALHIVRAAALTAAFCLAARAGVVPLFATLGGFLVVRFTLVRALGARPC